MYNYVSVKNKYIGGGKMLPLRALIWGCWEDGFYLGLSESKHTEKDLAFQWKDIR